MARARDQPGNPLYPTLHQMEANGLLTSTWEVVDGRPRRVYRASKGGHAHLVQAHHVLRELRTRWRSRAMMPNERVTRRGGRPSRRGGQRAAGCAGVWAAPLRWTAHAALPPASAPDLRVRATMRRLSPNAAIPAVGVEGDESAGGRHGGRPAPESRPRTRCSRTSRTRRFEGTPGEQWRPRSVASSGCPPRLRPPVEQVCHNAAGAWH